jgi:hypothetical protein
MGVTASAYVAAGRRRKRQHQLSRGVKRKIVMDRTSFCIRQQHARIKPANGDNIA